MKVINVGVIGAGRCGASFCVCAFYARVFFLGLPPHVDDKIHRCVLCAASCPEDNKPPINCCVVARTKRGWLSVGR